MNMRIALSGILFATLATTAFGQATNSADVTGTVTDATGAVVPGATISVQDLDKVTEHIVTSTAREFTIRALVPDDRYTITYAKSGFASLQRGPMTLRVGVIGLNAQLSVGQTTQQVVVNESAPLLETTTPEYRLPARRNVAGTAAVSAPDWQGFCSSAWREWSAAKRKQCCESRHGGSRGEWKPAVFDCASRRRVDQLPHEQQRSLHSDFRCDCRSQGE